MSDFGLTWDNDLGVMDLSVEDGDIVADEGLQTAVLLSIFTDRRGDPDSELLTTNLKGWWGDQFLADADDFHGSRIWQDGKDSAHLDEALQWMIDDGVCEDFSAQISQNGTRGDYEIIIYRPESETIDFRFDRVWDGEAAKW